MPAIERVIPIVGQFSDPIREMLARRLRELAGLSVLSLACVIAAALMTWSVQDPSLSHATSGAIRNVIGRPGAIGADLLMQIFGLGSIMLILPIAVWGWRLLTHRFFDREALRIACWILCAVAAAGLASCLPRSGAMATPNRVGRRGWRRTCPRSRRYFRSAWFDLSRHSRSRPVRDDDCEFHIRKRRRLPGEDR